MAIIVSNSRTSHTILMRHLIIFIVLGIVSSEGYAQQSIVDSLEVLIDQYEKPYDTNYVNLRNEYTNKRIFVEPSDTSLLAYALATLKHARDIEFPKGEALAYQRIGVIYQYFLANPLEAIDYYQRALEIIDEHPQLKEFTPASLNNIATIYYEQQELEKALSIYKKIMAEFEDNRTIQAQYIGNIYGLLEQYDSAIHYFTMAIDMAKIQKNYTVLAYTQSALSFMFSKVDRMVEAIVNTEECLGLVEEYELKLIRVPVYLNSAMVYLKNKEYTRAENYAMQALRWNETVKNLSMERSAYGTLFEIYEAKKDYQKALEAFKKGTVLEDSLTRADRKLEVSRKEIEFEAKKRQLAADLEIEKQKSSKNLTMMAGGGLMLIIIVSFVFYRQRQFARAKVNEAAFKESIAESKLIALRTQLNPHFIFNALNSIDNYMVKYGVDAASSYLTKFAKLMRSILENSESQWVTLENELELMSLYIEIEALRFNNKLAYDINVEESLDTDNILVPSLLLQPFVENSIVHGISKKETGGHITLEVKKEIDQLICVIEDDGVGRKNGKESFGDKSKKSMGMAITKSRIDYLNQITSDQFEFNITDLDNGVSVKLKLPLKLQF